MPTQVNEKGVNDDTNEVIMRKVGCEAIQCHGFDTGKTYDGSSGTDSPYIRHVNTKPNSKGITHHCHVREYATPLYGVNRLSLVLMTLQDLVKGKTHLPAQSSDSAHFFLVLDIFHRAGWVHRDISMGNDFLLQKHELFKLGDLGFAKKIGKGGAHDVRTVRITFQAICATLTDEGHSGFHVGRSGEASIQVSPCPFGREVLLPSFSSRTGIGVVPCNVDLIFPLSGWDSKFECSEGCYQRTVSPHPTEPTITLYTYF